MARYLSDEWFAAVSIALGPERDEDWHPPVTSVEGPDGETMRWAVGVGGDLEEFTSGLIIQQQVADSPDGLVVWHVRIDGSAPVVRFGPHPSPTVTFTQDYDTAAAVARGDLSAQEAFMTGRITLGGDAGALIAAASALTELGDALAEVRAATTY